MKFLGTKTLETERLILRKIKIEDAEIAFKNWCNSDMVDKYVMWKRHENVNVTINLYKNWIKEYDDLKTFRWIVELKENHDLLGTIDVPSKKYMDAGAVEIGYCYSDKYWNKGYATEVLNRIIRYLFLECDANIIFAAFMENNPASGKVMKKCGMTFEGTLRARVKDKENKINDLLYYSITKDEYLKLKMEDI